MKSLHSVVPSFILFFFTWVYGTTLLLSAAHSLTVNGIRVSCIFFLVSTAVWMKKTKTTFTIPRNWFVYVVLFFLALTFIQGYVSAPNTTDAMVYHLPRVVYWVQHQSVFQMVKYTAHDYMPAFAEYIVTFFYLLLGSDRLAFLPQWLSFLGVVCLSYLIPREFGATRSQARWISIIIFSLPILLLEATSTQTDLVMAFLLLFSLFMAVRYKKTTDWRHLVLVVGSISFAVITKQIALFIALPVLVSLFHTKLISWKNMKILVLCVVMGICIVGPYIAQNYVLYGSPFGQSRSDPNASMFFNETFTPTVLVSNVIRNVSLQLPFPGIAPVLEHNLFILGNRLNINFNDPHTTWLGTTFHIPSFPIPQEDIAPGPLQAILLCIGAFLVVRKGSGYQKTIVWSGVIAFLLFSLIFKWQPYNNRLEMGFLLTLLPMVLVTFWKYWPTVGKYLALISLMVGLGVILANTSRPFISYKPFASLVEAYLPEGSKVPQSIFTKPRDDQYYIARPYWMTAYRNVIENEKVRASHAIFIESIDGFAYPLMMELRRNGSEAMFLPEGKEGETILSTITSKNAQECYISSNVKYQICRIVSK